MPQTPELNDRQKAEAKTANVQATYEAHAASIRKSGADRQTWDQARPDEKDAWFKAYDARNAGASDEAMYAAFASHMRVTGAAESPEWEALREEEQAAWAAAFLAFKASPK